MRYFVEAQGSLTERAPIGFLDAILATVPDLISRKRCFEPYSDPSEVLTAATFLENQ